MYFWRLVGEVINKSDILILLADARNPELSKNKEVLEMIKRDGKSMVNVFNRVDLLSSKAVKSLKMKYPDYFLVSATENIGVRELRRVLHILGKKLGKNYPKIGVVGYPNVGKSALINTIARSAKARVADKPGTTRGIQWIKAGSLRILDSPGVIPLQDREERLVLIGAKYPEKLKNPEKLACDIIKLFLNEYPLSLQNHYSLTIKDLELEANDLLEIIGKRRGFLKKGAEVDELKTSLMIIRDWQKGKLRF